MNVEKVYEIVSEKNRQINALYHDLGEYKEAFHDHIRTLGIEIDDESLLALKKRVINLRSEGMISLFKKERLSEEEIIQNEHRLYAFVETFWMKHHESLIQEIKPYLSPFYQTLLQGVHKIGLVFNKWQVKWVDAIVYGINRELKSLYEADEQAIFSLLKEKSLLDQGHTKEVGDRSYSVLSLEGEEFYVKSYFEHFPEEVSQLTTQIELLIQELERLEDSYQREWIGYFESIKKALLETDRHQLIIKWADVDRKWMDIKSPIQIGHPLEYYEDHYRKAVALEFDLRIANPLRESSVKQNIVKTYNRLYQGEEKILHFSLQKIDQAQLYLGRPALFYGAELNGLFSAQVVPNDEIISNEKGKKIFAFADKILSDTKAKPKMLLSHKIFGEEFMQKEYELLENEALWHKVYDYTTVGHEFGHILWVDTDSEAVMNESGAYKNVEEFKATVGGLLAYFDHEEAEVDYYILSDTIKRAVSLIAWQEVDEVLPYYIEGLLHLTGLFESGMLVFDDQKLTIHIEKYTILKAWYEKTYTELALDFYLKKQDPKKFLDLFVKKEEVYLPKKREVREFVEYYYEQYQEIGQKTLV